MEKICIIALVNILFYWKTIYFNYVSDDLASNLRPKLKGWRQSFWVFEGYLKSTPQVDHFITIIIHTLVCVGIYLAFGSNDISFIAALLFAFNPINNQGAVWISGRGYALSALGMVWSLALPVEMGGLMLLGATYSNAGFSLPIILIGSNHSYLLLFMPFIWMFHIKRFKNNVLTKIKMEVFTEDKHIHPKKLILATKTFGFYVSHAIIPIRTTFYHSLLESISGCKSYRAYTLCRYFWIGTISLALTIWYVCTHRWDMICFGLLWWCVGIAPFLNLYRMQQELGERYAYLPNVGLMFILASFIHTNPYIVGGFVLMYATKTWFYINCYKDDYWVVEFARMNCPDSWFAWHIAALKRWEVKSYQEALILWVMAKNLSPKEFKLLFNIGTVLIIMGNSVIEPQRSNMIKEGLQFCDEASKNIPRGQEVMANELLDKLKKGQATILV